MTSAGGATPRARPEIAALSSRGLENLSATGFLGAVQAANGSLVTASLTLANDWQNPLPGVPDVESPFFEDLFARKVGEPGWLDIARRLQKNGFVVTDFPDPDFDRLAESIKTDLVSGYDFEGWRAKGHAAGDSLRIQDAWLTNEAVKRIASNEEVRRLLAYLYGRAAFPFQTLNFPVGTQQHFHSDSVHFSSIPERFMVGVWVALEDIDDTNGPLIYYPGSHKLPIYVNEHIGVFDPEPVAGRQEDFEPLWRDLMRVHGFKEERFYAKKGQMLIWASNLLHGGAPHIDAKRTRWSQVTHYYFENCAYFTPMHSDPAMGRIYFRDVLDAANGERIPNKYVGQEVPKSFLADTDPMRSQFLPAPLPEGFDPQSYLAANPDVATVGIDPAEHWRNYGRFEGRALAPDPSLAVPEAQTDESAPQPNTEERENVSH